MAKYFPLPNGDFIKVPDSMTYDEASSLAQRDFPELFNEGKAPGAQGGFMPALKAGYSSLKGDVAALAGKTGIMDEAAAEKYIAEQKAYQQQIFKPTEEGWTEAPGTKIKELLGGSLPYMAAPVAAAAGAAALPLTGGAATAAGLGATGLASLTQFTGSNLSRQMDEGKTLKQTELGSAALAAIPQAALDVVSFKMLPGVRGILGQAGKKMTTAEAEAFTKQGLAKVAGDYALATGKAMSVEGLTEAGQQFFERLQAGLNIDDAQARDEYWQSLVGGAVLGGAISPAGRYIERGGKQQEAKTLLAEEANAKAIAARGAAQQAAAQKAAEAEAFKQSPEYALKKQAEYEEAAAKMKALREASKDPGKDADPVAKEEAKMAKAEMAVFGKEVMQPLAKEYAELKRTGVFVDLAKQQANANLTPMEAMMGQRPPQVPSVPTLSAEGPATTPFTEMATSTATPMGKAQAYAAQQVALANDKSLTPAKDRGDQVGDYTQYLLQDPVLATQLVQNNVRIPGMNVKMNQAVLANLRDTLKMQRAAGMLDNAGNRLRPQEVPAAQQAVESEEAQALEASRQAEEQQRIDAARERQIAPEVLALQRMQKRPTQTMGLPGFGTAPEEKKGSAAIGQMEQSLRGVVPGQELLFTADETPTPAKAQKGPGGGFRLFNEQGERQLSDAQAYRNLSERLAIASSNPDLSDEAYNFLRRAEMALPKVNTRLETARKEPVKKGEGTLAAREYAEDVAASESFYKLLDEQLARIERGEEGSYQSQRYVNEQRERAKGTTADVTPSEGATPYQTLRQSYREASPTDLMAEKRRITKLKKFPKGVEQPEGERAVANVPGAPVEKRERQTTGRTIRGEAPALSMTAELEPLIRAQEQAAGQGPIAQGQKELFKSEGEKLGIQRANFKALMNSKVVQKLRDTLQKDKKDVAEQVKALPALKAKVDELNKQVKEMQTANVEYSQAMSVIRHNTKVAKLGKERDAANAALLDMDINRKELAGRIEELLQLRASFDAQLNKMGEFQYTELATRFEPLLSEYSTVQKELASLNTDLAVLDDAMKQLDTELRVEKARADLARLNPVTVSKDALEAAKEQLRAAQVNAGVAEAEIRKAELARKEAEGKAKREAEAVARAEAEKTRVNVDKEYQRRLEAAYGTSATGQEYDIITMAQREAQEMKPVAFTVEENKKIMANPNAVLAGLRSRITGLERIMKASYNKSKEFNDQKLRPTGATVAELTKAYNGAKTDEARSILKFKIAATRVAELSTAFQNAKSADERAAITPKLEAAEREYDEKAEYLRDEPVMWKGRAGQMKELAMLYNKADQLEADIQAGRIAQPEEFERKSPTLKPSAGEKAGAAAAAQATEVEEATQRATAPTTTGDAGVTRMKAAKLNKPEGTLYSSKGASPEVLSKDQKEALNRIKEKQAAGKPINDFEKALVERAQRMETVLKSANNPPELSRGAVNNGTTATALQAELDKIVGGKGITQSRVRVFDSVDAFYAQDANASDAYPDLPSDAKAFVDPATGKTVMFANNIGKGEGLGVLLHEVGAHLGFRNLFNAAQYNGLIKTVKAWAARNDGSIESQVAKAAMARVEAAQTTDAQYDDELLAYAVEEAVKAGVSPDAMKGGSALRGWLNAVLNTLKKALADMGFITDKLTAGDLVNLAYGAAQLEMRGTWHGSDATFTAFDTKYAGTGEGVFDRRFDGDNSLGAGPYVTPDKEYGEYYQHAIPFGKAAIETGYGKKTYQDYRDMDETFMTTAHNELSVAELQNKYESRLLSAYLMDVSAGGELDPTKNAVVQSTLQGWQKIAKEKDAKAIATLSADKIKGLTERPPKGNLYRTLDAIPREKVLSVNSMAKYGERPAIDKLHDKYTSFVTTKDGQLKDVSLKDGQYPLNGLFYKMRRELGLKETIRLLKDAGIEAIEQKNDRKYIERAYIDQAPEILALNIQPVGQADGLLYSKKPKYDTDDALSQLASKIVAQPKSFQERLGKNMALEAEMEVVDMRAAIREFTNIGSKAFNNDKQFTQAMASVLKADQYMPLVSASLESGPLEMYEDAKGLRQVKSSGKDSAVEVFKAIEAIPAGNSEGKFALASAYMIAQRAANKGLTALDLGALEVDQADLDAAMAAADANPKLKDALENAREKYNAYNAGQIKFLAETGYISKATAKEWLKDGDYVPYYRVRDDGTAELVLGGEKTITVGDVRHQPYLAELKGGQTKILPLNESIMRNTMLITKAGMSNLAAKELGYAMQMIGQGAGPVDPKTGLATNKMAIHSGMNPGGPDIIVFKQEPNPKDPKDDGQRWVRVDTEDTVAEGIPSALLVRSLEGAHLTLPAFLKIGGIAGDLLRKGITRMPPYILRQLYRDPMAASFTAGLNYGPFTAVAKAGKEFIASSRGESKTGAELIKKGLVQSGIYTGDPDDMSSFALQLASGKDGNAINNFLAMLDRAAIRADSSTRALVYENAIANGLSEVEADMMVMESMNFYKRGLSPTVQYANRLIPFMNAQIQGLNVLYKAATGKMPFNEQQQIKRKFYNNAMILFATGFAYALAMEDDETFKNAKARDKYTNFFVNVPGVDEAMKIAIPYEAGWFFSAAVAAVDAFKEETDGKQQLEAVRDMFLGAVPGYSSKFVPQAVKPLFEVFTNKSFFSGNNIESQSLQGKTPEQRFNNSTTEGAKMLAQILPGLSPIQIDYLSKAYFGAAPILALSAAGNLFAKEGTVEKPEPRLSQNAVFGSMFQRKFGGADADVVYKLAEEATQAQTTFNSMKKTGAPEDIKDYLEDHRAELAAAPAARKFISNMSKLKTQEDIITNRSNLSAEEKRKRLDALDEARQNISKQYMQIIKRVESQS